eukprot:TRINITY_DN31037_c0_g1_i1.p1 TRINITY_DN31037_c0_g1~~TRINITY_DN31037_c0_g1_i1.p1  ORF type:complete len:188 (-),score=31.12 TRINITY_DN31037_c0_g1_i1:28-591(-)
MLCRADPTVASHGEVHNELLGTSRLMMLLSSISPNPIQLSHSKGTMTKFISEVAKSTRGHDTLSALPVISERIVSKLVVEQENLTPNTWNTASLGTDSSSKNRRSLSPMKVPLPSSFDQDFFDHVEELYRLQASWPEPTFGSMAWIMRSCQSATPIHIGQAAFASVVAADYAAALRGLLRSAGPVQE